MLIHRVLLDFNLKLITSKNSTATVRVAANYHKELINDSKMKLQSLVFFISLLLVFNQGETQNCNNNNKGDIRLRRNSTIFEGQLEVCRPNNWGAVIDSFWTANDEAVVCRQLGFEITGDTIFNKYQIRYEGRIIVENVQCRGDEDRLFDCLYQNKWTNGGNVVGVHCKEERPPQNVSVQDIDDSVVTLSWSTPLPGATNEAVEGYSVDCTTVTSQNSTHITQLYVDNETTTADMEHLLPSSSYNCCVEVLFESYSSRACVALERESEGETLASAGNGGRANTVGGVLGFIIAVLVILIVLAGIILMYPRVIEPRIRDSGFYSRYFYRFSSWLMLWTASSSKDNHTHNSSANTERPAVTNVDHTPQTTADYAELELEGEYSIIGPSHPPKTHLQTHPQRSERYEFSGSYTTRHNDYDHDVGGVAEYEVPFSPEGGEESTYSHLQH